MGQPFFVIKIRLPPWLYVKSVIKALIFNFTVIGLLAGITYLISSREEITKMINASRYSYHSIYFLPYWEKAYNSKTAPVAWWYFTKYDAFLTSIFEEIAFRGPVVALLRSGFYLRFGKDLTPLIIISAVLALNFIWAQSHYFSVTVFITGLTSYWLVLKTKTIWPSVVFHFLCNFSIYILIQIVIYLKLI